MKIQTVLHIDDDKIIGRMVKLVLEKMAGWEVEYCSSCEAALEYIKRNEPDIVLLDIMMPDADGPTTLKTLRRQGLSEDVPAIFMSAKVMSGMSENFSALDIAGIIQKPFNPATLTDEIQLLVDKFETNRRSERQHTSTVYGGVRNRIRSSHALA